MIWNIVSTTGFRCGFGKGDGKAGLCRQATNKSYFAVFFLHRDKQDSHELSDLLLHC